MDDLSYAVAPQLGWLVTTAFEVPIFHSKSPNFNSRPVIAHANSSGQNDAQAALCPTIDLLVIHNISLPAGQFGQPYVIDLFMNRLDLNADESFASLKGVHVSAHFFIERTGAVVQFVNLFERAWHAGVSRFGGRENCNDFSVGIELEGTDSIAFTEAQYHSLLHISRRLQQTLALTAVTSHAAIAPHRKTDPGPAFDWVRYQRDWQQLAGAACPQFVLTPQG